MVVAHAVYVVNAMLLRILHVYVYGAGMADTDVAPAEPLVSGAEIARIAGVTRAAVSNWRRRYDDFPAPVGGGANSPLYDLADVRAWLAAQSKGEQASSEVLLWQELRSVYGENMVAGLADVARHLTGDNSGPALSAETARLADELAAERPPAELVENLVERLVDAARRSGSDHVTSAHIVRAVCHFAGDVAADAVVFDPACGVGTLLLTFGAPLGPQRFGQERSPENAALARLRGALAGRSQVTVAEGDSLRGDQWPQLRADVVICDPPVGVTDWGRESLLLDARWEFGTPPRAEGELAWLQHAYAHTAPGGRVLMVMPASVAYRKSGRRIRAELVRRGLLTRVVALPSGVAASHALPVHLWELRRPGAAHDNATSVRMVDLTGNSSDGSLHPKTDQVAEVPLIDLLDEVVDLTPGLYTDASHRDYAADYAALKDRLRAQLEDLAELLPHLTEGTGAASFEGATVSVSELARAGLVEYGGEGPSSSSDQLDTDYLQGFLRSVANRRRSTSASGTYRPDGRGARIPQLDIGRQRRYGRAFRALQDFEHRVQNMADLGREAAELARDGLTGGALAPGEGEDG